MIRKAQYEDLNVLDELSKNVIKNMHENRIFQWSEDYPRKMHFERDINQDALYVYCKGKTIIGAMAFYEENDPPYRSIEWIKSRSVVIHRILVNPNYQKLGIASQFLDFVVKYAKTHDYESIKIDTHPGNMRMRNFLKSRQFLELDYIKPMHRIGYERLIEKDLSKIMILGSSGTGKTTLAKLLSTKLKIPYIPLDTVYWQENWSSLSKDAFAKEVRNYLKTHKSYIMEGNYTNSVTFGERLKHANTIIILDYPVKNALKGIIEREAKYKHIYRSDMASGCIENIDQEFLDYVYHFKNKARKMIAQVNKYRGEKLILQFKDRKRLVEWFDTL